MDKPMKAKNADVKTATLEHQINIMVYHLNGLNYQEACVIDANLLDVDL